MIVDHEEDQNKKVKLNKSTNKLIGNMFMGSWNVRGLGKEGSLRILNKECLGAGLDYCSLARDKARYCGII